MIYLIKKLSIRISIILKSRIEVGDESEKWVGNRTRCYHLILTSQCL